jgi:transposase
MRFAPQRYRERAGWHTSPQVEVPNGMDLVFIPPYSPELQPAERLWPLTNEAIANKCFETLTELEEILFQRCRALLSQCGLIHGLTCYHWWPESS